MKIKNLMTPEPRTCTRETNLAQAAALMLDADCGILPVVDEQGKLIGVVTDRDMYIALATMKQHHVRRLPVEGFGATVAGVVSMNDILLAAGKKGVGNAEIVDTFQAICAHRHQTPHVTAA